MVRYGCRDVVACDADVEVVGRDCVRNEEQDGGLIVRLVERPAVERSGLVAIPHGGEKDADLEAMRMLEVQVRYICFVVTVKLHTFEESMSSRGLVMREAMLRLYRSNQSIPTPS